LLKRLVILIILLFLFLTDAEAETIAKVGIQDISRPDVAYHIAVEKAYGNETMTEAVALIALINDAIEQEVGRINGVIITPEELASLRKHADETSKAPEILAKVKSVFGDNLTAYDRLYLLPRIMNRKLRSWYSRNAEIHQKARASIEKAYSFVKSGKTFEEAAKTCGLTHTTNEYKTEAKAVPDALRPYAPHEAISPADPMIAILQTLSENEVYRNIVEDDDSYRVIRLLKKDGAAYRIEAITVPKQPFQQWFKEQEDKVTLTILDKSLEKEIVSKYPKVSWVKKRYRQ
jgi:hypothetical protein